MLTGIRLHAYCHPLCPAWLHTETSGSFVDKPLVIIESELLGEGAFSRVCKVTGKQRAPQHVLPSHVLLFDSYGCGKPSHFAHRPAHHS